MLLFECCQCRGDAVARIEHKLQCRRCHIHHAVVGESHRGARGYTLRWRIHHKIAALGFAEAKHSAFVVSNDYQVLILDACTVLGVAHREYGFIVYADAHAHVGGALFQRRHVVGVLHRPSASGVFSLFKLKFFGRGMID